MRAYIVQEYLEIYEDQKLFTQMQRAARRSGHKGEDAVELVRRVRREVRESRGATYNGRGREGKVSYHK